MRKLRAVLLLSASFMLPVACATSSASPRATSSPAASTSSATATATTTEHQGMPAMIPDGTYSTTIVRADAPDGVSVGLADSLSGTWTLTMTGSHFVARFNGAEVVSSEYHSIPNQQVHFPDNDTGSMACHMDGVYAVTLAGHQVSFAKVRDECLGRVMVLTAHPLVMQM
jgi:hypothetical protein